MGEGFQMEGNVNKDSYFQISRVFGFFVKKFGIYVEGNREIGFYMF